MNGETRQDADIGDLIWSVPDVVSIISRSMRLMPGDLIYTGTPEGVGPLLAGDAVEGEVEGVGRLAFRVL